jgi:hypothetical protein
MLYRKLTLAHQLDIAWIIALWKAIHGGDPAPDGPIAVDERTTELVSRLVDHLTQTQLGEGAQATELTAPVLQQRAASLGIRVSGGAFGEALTLQDFSEPGEPEGYIRPRMYCFQFEGEVICIQLPRVGIVHKVAQ